MTVKPIKDTKARLCDSRIEKRANVLSFEKVANMDKTKSDPEELVDMGEDQSPKSVVAAARKEMGFVHSQVLRIREEDSHLGQDIGDKVLRVASTLDVVFFSRPILPCSPLSRKKGDAVKASP